MFRRLVILLLPRTTMMMILIFGPPILGMLGAIAILEFVPRLVRQLPATASADWDGEEHVFETHRLRIQMIGRHAWIVDAGLLRVLGEQSSETQRRRADAAHYAQIPDIELWGFSEKGAVKLLRENRHPDALKLRLALERNVFFQARKRRNHGSQPGTAN